MTLGDSGGRSARNPVGRNARRRNTPRERAHVDPPLDLLETLIPAPVARAAFHVAAYLAVLVIIVFALIIFGAWFDVL